MKEVDQVLGRRVAMSTIESDERTDYGRRAHVPKWPLYDHHSTMRTSLSRELDRPVDEVVPVACDNATMIDGRLNELLLVRPFFSSVLVHAFDIETEAATNPGYVRSEVFVNQELHRGRSSRFSCCIAS
jgi:hypothetical protein